MWEQGYISEEQYLEAKETPLELQTHDDEDYEERPKKKSTITKFDDDDDDDLNFIDL